MIWLRALSFILAVQVTVLAVVPWLLAADGAGPRLEIGAARWAGLLPLALGAAALLWCNAAFVVRGRGTAAPYDPPRELVAAGLYRHVRNPMYVSAALIVLGEALLARRAVLLGYAAALAVAYHLFVRLYEEPRLRRSFGPAYASYCAEVPRWLPRLRPAARR